ncbi:alpha/beta fold hydrolase [Aeoliella sp. SH292]|uniref:alpha/beta fold hydrolase n=1 Tax=Aeoliella sp. SH292 TaxID=3454464 RepID=UPI003F9D8A0E
MLFIQGVGCAGCAWKPQTDGLREKFDCLRFDNRGIGQSCGDTKKLTIDEMVNDAIGLLDALNIERTHVVGHSMGGVVAYELALRHPERVKSLALLCTFHRGKDVLAPTLALLKHGLLTSVGTASMRRRAFARMVFSPSHIAALGIDAAVKNLSDVFERDLAKLPPVSSRQIRALSRHDSTSELHALATIPSMVIAGEYDPIARRAGAKKLADAIQADKLYILEEGSHALPIQSPEKVNSMIEMHARQSTGV